MDDLNSFIVFQDRNSICFIKLNTHIHGILHNNTSKNNFYSKESELQRIIQNNKWKNHVICGEFNLFALLVNYYYIINYLSIFQHGSNIEIFILLNYILSYIFFIFSHIAVLCIFMDPNTLRFVFLLVWIFHIILMLMDSTTYIINFGIPLYSSMCDGVGDSEFSFGFNVFLYLSQYHWPIRL